MSRASSAPPRGVASALCRSEVAGHPLAADLYKALNIVLRDHKNVPGIKDPLPSYRGPDKSSWIQDLARNKNVNGPMYEMIGTAALKVNPPRGLAIYSTDSLIFGAKSGTGHVLPADADYRHVTTTGRRSVESDVLIERTSGPPFFEYTSIGVDFKFRSGGSVGKDDNLKEQLEGVKSALLLGELSEYHFVSNTRFSDPFINAVDEVNDILKSAATGSICLHECVNVI